MSSPTPDLSNLSLATMAPSVALALFDNFAVLIIAGVPSGTEFGIDRCNFVVGEDFRGVKMIPEGFHFVYCSARGAYGETAPRVGFVHYFTRSEIVVREWDHEKEELRHRVHAKVKDEMEKIRENLRNLDKYLAPYDYDNYIAWQKLTGNITQDTVRRHSPNCGVIRNTVELLSCPDEERPRGQVISPPRLSKFRALVNDEELLPNLKSIPGTEPNFTTLPPRCPKNASPADVSRHHMDCIEAVDLLLSGREQQAFEEIEFSFILFVCGHSVEGLAHWRKILGLLSNSERAVEKYRIFYRNFLTVLQYQLPNLPIELMEQTQSNTVYMDVRRLLLNCYKSGLTSVAQTLENSLNDSLLWKFEDLLSEDPEDLPTVVEL